MRNTAALLLLTLLAGPAAAGDAVRVYISHDEAHAQKLIAAFTKATGFEVEATYDTERTKTVGFKRQLLAERAEPQADVFWNNELATTILLKNAGVLAPYISPSASGIPAAFKDPEGYWTGFGARARILIVNTDLVAEEDMPDSMWDLADSRWKGKVCMAKPHTGTTAAHAVALYVLDREEADRYFDALIENEVKWLTGNAHCMRDVSAGRFAFGWTDTDDFNVARLQGAPVKRVFPDAAPDGIGVMFIPNSVMLIKGGPNPEGGKKFIDWLLKPETEAMLAESDSAQIPVRPGVPVPDHVKRPDQIGKTMVVDFETVGREYDRWQSHLRAKFAAAQETSRTLIWILVALVAAGLLGFAFLKRATGEPA